MLCPEDSANHARMRGWWCWGNLELWCLCPGCWHQGWMLHTPAGLLLAPMPAVPTFVPAATVVQRSPAEDALS